MNATEVKIKSALLDVDIDDKVTFIGKVYAVGEVESYQNKANQDRSYFEITVVDSTSPAKIKVYKKTNKFIKSGKTYKFMNVIRKIGGFWSIASSTILAWSQISDADIPQEIIEETIQYSQKQEANSPRNLKEALRVNTTSKIRGKVVQVSPIKMVRNGELPLRFVSLKDQHATVKMALFNKEAESTYNQGDVLAVSNVYQYKDNATLSTKTSTTVEFLPMGEMDEVTITDKDYLSDDDFNDNEGFETAVKNEHFSVMGISRVSLYKCCSKMGCKKKKLVCGKCPYCQETSIEQNYNCYVAVKREDAEEMHTIFANDMSLLVDLPNPNEIENEDQLLDLLVEKLPITGTGSFYNGKMEIQRKRKTPS